MSTHHSPAPTDGTAVIVGASLAGATAAFTLRERGFTGQIVLIGAETELPYERPALSKSYLEGDMLLDELLVRSAEDYDEQQITLRLRHAAIALSVNNGKDLRRAKQLIGHAVDPATLADATIDLRQLAPLAVAAS